MNKFQKGSVKLFIPIIVFIFATGLLYFIFRNTQKESNKTENPPGGILVSPTPTIDQASGTEPPTLEWAKFSGNDFVYTNNIYTGYSIKYPETCTLNNSSLTCKFTEGSGVIQINAGGHGAEPEETRVIKSNEAKIIPAGEGKITLIELVKTKKVVGTFWINKTDKLTQEPIFGFEFNDIPVEDLPEFEQMFDLMLTTFKFTEKNANSNPSGASNTKDGCVISGCSGEICAEEEMASTCIFKPENACYAKATCEKQANNKCGWTETEELTSCLNQN